MAKLSVRYLVRKPGYRAEDGTPLTWRWYWQPSAPLRAAGWAPRRLHADTQADAVAQAEALNRAVDEWRNTGAQVAEGGSAQRSTGTVDQLIGEYRRSRFFTERAERTRRDYAQDLDWIAGVFGGEQVRALDKADIQAAYQALLAKAGPRVAQKRMTMLTILFNHAEDLFGREHPCYVARAAHPAQRLGLVAPEPTYLLWPVAFVADFTAWLDAAGWPSVADAVAFNDWFGQRPADLLRLKTDLWQGDGFWFRQSKRDAGVFLPVDAVPHLAERRARAEARRRRAKVDSTHLIVDDRTGEPWSYAGFTRKLAQLREDFAAAERFCYPADFLVSTRVRGGSSSEAVGPTDQTDILVVGLEFRFLRHTAITNLHNAGVPREDIAGISGHAPGSIDRILGIYRRRTQKAAVAAFRRRVEQEGKGCATCSTPSVKPRRRAWS